MIYDRGLLISYEIVLLLFKSFYKPLFCDNLPRKDANKINNDSSLMKFDLQSRLMVISIISVKTRKINKRIRIDELLLHLNLAISYIIT